MFVISTALNNKTTLLGCYKPDQEFKVALQLIREAEKAYYREEMDRTFDVSIVITDTVVGTIALTVKAILAARGGNLSAFATMLYKTADVMCTSYDDKPQTKLVY